MPVRDPLLPAIAGSLVKVSCICQTGSTLSITSFHYFNNVIGSVGPSDLVDLSTAWKAQFATHFRACLSPLTTLLWTYLAEIHYGTCPSFQGDFAGGTVGTAGTSNLPMETAAIISKYSAVKGKHGRGRIFMPAIPNTFTTPATDADTLNATATTAYGNLQADMTATLTAGAKTWVPYIVSSPVPPAIGADFGTTLLSTVLRTTLSTVRRRRKGRGI